MADEEAEIYKLWRIRKTVLNLCHDRGYLIAQEELDQTVEQFKQEFVVKRGLDRPSRSDLTVHCAHNDNSDDMMYVFFPDEAKIGIRHIQGYVSKMESEKVQRAIVIVRQGLTPSARQAIKEVGPTYMMEEFLESEMLINITEHELVPQHTLLTVEEKQELFSRYKLKEAQLMKMLAGDPVARYYGFKRGQVIKIVRKSDTAGRYVTHRLVV
uniref:DNA-directed RNA polymerases I, II, and III subunit RPABC1 n=1 Tax=Aceria tosichella TaxID=561515 RepID=A0A6G1S414_9ACAR